MKKLSLIIVTLIVVTTITVFAIGPLNVMIYLVKPHHSFENDTRAPAPDYSRGENWIALPATDDLADLRPEGVAADTSLQNVDVFFIHPTGYLKGDHWNATLDPNTVTEENTKWMMANQASAFSDCAVYAPRYRQATIYSFFDIEAVDQKAALDLAYQDVARSFDYFLKHYNQGRPFILASHSQGSFHALRLLKDKIDNTPAAQRLVAAYTIGMSTITDDAVVALTDITVCDGPDQTNCLIHWATFAEGTPPQEGWDTPMVCVNPLTWRRDEELADADIHKGYVPATGTYDLSFYGDDKAKNTVFDPLGPPKTAYTHAFCKEGRLFIAQQSSPSMAMGEGNYHGLDFQLFHMDIRKNVSERTRAFLSRNDKTSTSAIDTTDD